MIIITLRVKSPNINMHEQYLQKGMFVKAKNFDIQITFKRGFKKGNMHVVIIVESTIIVSLITPFEPELVPMFSHMDSIRVFRNFIQSWSSIIIVITIVGVKGEGNSTCEKPLLITNGEGEFDPTF